MTRRTRLDRLFRWPGHRPDLATLSGIALAIGGILGGLLLEQGRVGDLAQATAAMIVLGGTLGAVLVTTPLSAVLRAVAALGGVFLEIRNSTGETLERLVQLAAKARRFGVASLEADAAALPDPFLRKALGLAADGTESRVIRDVMELDMRLSEEAAEEDARVWESAGGYAPTIGIMGAVIGLIQVMKHLDDIQAVGHGIAVAFVATVYGVGSANLFFLPAANKLRARARRESRQREMMLEGALAIAQGCNPRLVRLKLESFDENRGKVPKPAPPGPKPAGVQRAEPRSAEA
jgi:chemotaxis protein MotA